MQPDWQALIDQTVQDESLCEAYFWEPFGKGSSNLIFLGRLKQDHHLKACSGILAEGQSSAVPAFLKTVVLRINAQAKDTPGVDRKREATILEWIKPYRWAPQIIRDEPEQGWCLIQYYEESIKAEKQMTDPLPVKFHDLLLGAVDELHGIDISIDLNSDPNLTKNPTSKNPEKLQPSISGKENLITNYETLLNKAYLGKAKAKNDTQALEWIQSIKYDIATLPKLPQCLVHHDLHRGNLVISANSNHAATHPSLTILDWEYASIGSPWFDASCLSRYLSIPADKIHQLTLFKPLKKTTFDSALKQANEMTKTLQDLWYRTRE